MPKIFISHAHEDHAALYNSLQSRFDEQSDDFSWHNLSVPKHRRVADGRELPEAELRELILAELSKADVVVVIATEAASRRPWIRWELAQAYSRGIPIVAIWRRRLDKRVSRIALRYATTACDTGNIRGIINAIHEALELKQQKLVPADNATLLPSSAVSEPDEYIEPLEGPGELAPIEELALQGDEVVGSPKREQTPREALHQLGYRLAVAAERDSQATPIGDVFAALPKSKAPEDRPTPPTIAPATPSVGTTRWWWPFDRPGPLQ